jgi:hypothetical protein
MLSLIFIALIASGCGTTPYAEAFIGYRVGGDESFHSCSNENAGIRLGIERELTSHVVGKLEYEHISHLLCGSPFNDKREDGADHVGIVLRYEW